MKIAHITTYPYENVTGYPSKIVTETETGPETEKNLRTTDRSRARSRARSRTEKSRISSKRQGILIKVEGDGGQTGWGDITPLPERSKESLAEATQQFEKIKTDLYAIDWNISQCLNQIQALNLFPSNQFALESALLSMLDPLPPFSIPFAPLLMGKNPEEIIKIAKERKQEGCTSAKLKIGNLSADQAFEAISALKDDFKLRIDVNSLWPKAQVLKFFDQFPLDTFDYVEDPLQDLSDLSSFTHPVAIEEPLAKGFDLSQLSTQIKAVIYKPTVLGGMLAGQKLQKWAKENRAQMVLSSSFESDVGHYHLAQIAHRLKLTLPIGIGTYHYLEKYFMPKFDISNGKINLNV